MQKYDDELPTASVIMCFYNEHLSTLIRSINSVIVKTPSQYLKEIILVDDASDLRDLQDELERRVKELKSSKKIKILRNSKREGLIRSRVFGARNATADTLIFLDSHIEVNKDWIQPLLHLIKHNRSAIAVPIIDIINADTFIYSSSPLVIGGFTWSLHYRWDMLPKNFLKSEQDYAGPFPSPTMAGGLFAINRKYFTELGEYDMKMDTWGNLLSFNFHKYSCFSSDEIFIKYSN